MTARTRTPLPPWLAHALSARWEPVPWGAVVRGACAAGPLLAAALLAGWPSAGVTAALGAMFAGINDRPGGRRAAVHRLGTPAVCGAAGLAFGTVAGDAFAAVALTLVLAAAALVAGAVSAVGPVASAAGTQFLVMCAVGAGAPLPAPAWQRAVCFLLGAGWLIALRQVAARPAGLRAVTRERRAAAVERAAVAQAYRAVAALLEAAGTPQATARRTALTAALDQAQDALAGPWWRSHASTAAERRLHARFAAVLPLAEAATALAWAGETVPRRAVESLRRLAAAVGEAGRPGPLPAPERATAALRRLDEALLQAALTFDRGDDAVRPHALRRGPGAAVRTALGPGGREYGLRVALSFGAGAAVAQALHHTHWYWLPATAVFLVKPDLGPLVSRVLCRAAGTVLGAALFAGAAALLPRPAGEVALVVAAGSLIPLATRHFAAQTAVVTVLVLALMVAGGEPQAAVARIGETLLACGIVLLVGHLPVPGRAGGRVGAQLADAAGAAEAHLAHVLGEPDAPRTGDRLAQGRTLRREAYRTLAKARAAAALAAAELPLPAHTRGTAGAGRTAALLEELVDTVTACAVQLDDTGHLTARHTRRLTQLLEELAAAPRPRPRTAPLRTP
ncbi:FUSC family protein [Streptomyces fragilis]|uniref:FUSC family protein n=1 Tax=Streptomyces fragilis TaxID=67301 RepID=A0ABV2YBC5_9ACTN|nr:FUSC family protein [Streptomyces fragilis]